MSDLNYMRRAIELAAKGAGLVSPNPMVGAVVVKDGRVIGEGYHRYDRLKHAESFALEAAGDAARGAVLYCSLEPCCHHGRTPPCTDSLIAAGIKRVVIATGDPDRRVNGKGIELLRAAGIEVEVGLLGREAASLNEAYNKYVTEHVPFVHALAGPADQQLLQEWQPSSDLLRIASHADALVLGMAPLNTIFLNACLLRERHRPFIVVGDKGALEAAGFTSSSSNVVPILVREVPGSVGEISRALAELKATSVLFLPGALSVVDLTPMKVDKVTLIRPKVYDGNDPCLPFALEASEEVDAGKFFEITGLLSESERID